VSGKSGKTKGMAGTYANGTHENTMDNEKGEEDGMSLYEVSFNAKFFFKIFKLMQF
jgi:hypothetical protein